MQVEKLTSKVYAIHMAATGGYKAFVKSYAGHPMKKVFDVASLDLSLTAKCFGLKTPPFVDIGKHDLSKFYTLKPKIILLIALKLLHVMHIF